MKKYVIFCKTKRGIRFVFGENGQWIMPSSKTTPWRKYKSKEEAEKALSDNIIRSLGYDAEYVVEPY